MVHTATSWYIPQLVGTYRDWLVVVGIVRNTRIVRDIGVVANTSIVGKFVNTATSWCIPQLVGTYRNWLVL